MLEQVDGLLDAYMSKALLQFDHLFVIQIAKRGQNGRGVFRRFRLRSGSCFR